MGCRVVNNSLWLVISLEHSSFVSSILSYGGLALCASILDVIFIKKKLDVDIFPKLIFIEILGREF